MPNTIEPEWNRSQQSVLLVNANAARIVLCVNAHERLVKALSMAQGQLKTVIEDCDMALKDQWDRSDDGFVAMKENCAAVVAEARAALAAVQPK